MQEKLKLPQITLVAMTSVNIKETIQAMEYSMRGIEFGDAVLITHKKPIGLPKNIRYSHTSELTDIDAFNYKMVYELGDHIHTDYAMIVHADGFIVHPEMWRDEFLKYDYIGAPWPLPKESVSWIIRKRQIFHGKVSMHTVKCGIMRMDLSAARSNIFWKQRACR